MPFHVRVETDGAVYVGSVRELPGCVTIGHTLDELRANMEDAIEGYLESVHQRGAPVEFEEVTA